MMRSCVLVAARPGAIPDFGRITEGIGGVRKVCMLNSNTSTDYIALPAEEFRI